MSYAATANENPAVRLGRRLEYATIGWNGIEAVVALVAGAIAGSIALTGFGFDSAVEIVSAAAVIWRLRIGASAERTALRIVGGCFLVLSVYVLAKSVLALQEIRQPEESWTGIVLAALSLLAMPLLAAAKRRVASALGSEALRADARQTDLCAWLSAILLVGLLLNAALGWWWADPVAGLCMSPLIAREGIAAWSGKPCGCASSRSL